VKPFHEIPGVELSPVRRIKKTILGLLGSEKTNSIDLHVNTIKKHGKLVRISASSLSGNLRTLLVLVARPEDIASVLRNIGPTPYRPNMEILKTTLEERNYVSGLIWTQGEEWRSLRSRSSKQILLPNVLKHIPLINAIAEDFVDYAKKHRGVSGYLDDIHLPLTSWAFEGLVIFLLSKRLNILANPAPEVDELKRKAAEFVRGTSYMGRSLSLHKFLPTPGLMRFLRAAEFLQAWAEQCIWNNHQQTQVSNSSSDAAIGFLDQWLLDGRLSQEEIAAQLRDFFAGGIDTTSLVATVMLHELAKNPQVQDRLYEEVVSVLGPLRQLDEVSYQKLPYTKSVLKEIYRCHPISVGIPTTLANDVVLSGYRVPAGTKILPVPSALGRDPEYFEDPDVFLPERWMGGKHHPFVQVPFGFGPRACYGRRLAELELTMLLIQVILSLLCP
jgi:cytochrome P450